MQNAKTKSTPTPARAVRNAALANIARREADKRSPVLGPPMRPAGWIDHHPGPIQEVSSATEPVRISTVIAPSPALPPPPPHGHAPSGTQSADGSGMDMDDEDYVADTPPAEDSEPTDSSLSY
ncbi:unnamed protein product [Sympodiomycopsis kandeliae]